MSFSTYFWCIIYQKLSSGPGLLPSGRLGVKHSSEIRSQQLLARMSTAHVVIYNHGSFNKNHQPLAVLVFRCRNQTAPNYLARDPQWADTDDSRRRLRSETTQKLLMRRTRLRTIGVLHRASGTTCLLTSFLHRHWPFSSGAWRLICLDNHSADNWPCYLSLKICLRQDKYCR